VKLPSAADGKNSPLFFTLTPKLTMTDIYPLRFVVPVLCGMSDKKDISGEEGSSRRPVPPGCPYRFVPDEWTTHGVPLNADP